MPVQRTGGTIAAVCSKFLYARGVRELRIFLVVVLILTALMLACKSEPVPPTPQAGDDAAPQAAATIALATTPHQPAQTSTPEPTATATPEPTPTTD